MRQQIYIVVDQRGVRSMARKKKPGLRQNERMITLVIDVPNSVFDLPAMKATVIVPESNVKAPQVIVTSVP